MGDSDDARPVLPKLVSDPHQSRQAYYEEQRQKRRQEIERSLRFESRNNVEELLQPILSLDLVASFHEKSLDELTLPTVPNSFRDPVEYL